ncbi:peptidylprolyl isomerase [Erythrobacter sp. KY5]|uniref:peptidylprolyl isomerase n=1 Tax=Erythrobacter sp. KY5 TaxID=2011159 RepID=UPI000DBF2D30|nr:peptidylprolyl isomerase [Erythrobacter sp. KY5]AWW75303.1 peptidylprolyl isomerase [Erythrobacter sp. KY5]
MKVFASIRNSVAALALAGLVTAPAAAQTTAVPTADNPLGIPENFTVFGSENPNERSATAVVNGFVITGTDIDQRVALVTNASEVEVSEAERQRLRVQVLRNLIDETLKIQAAAAQEVGVERAEVEQTYQQLAAQNFGQNPERMDEYLASIGSSPAALKRQIEGEIAWENLIRRNISPFVNVSAEEVSGVLERLEEARGTEEYRLGEIYMNATEENREAVIQNMQRIMEQLEAGGSFVAYARQFSEASTAVQGGDTGFLRLATLPGPMADAARQMQPGQLVGPIAIPGGFTIIYLIDRRQVLTADPRDSVLNLKQISIAFAQGTSEAEANAKIEEFGLFIQSLRSCNEAETARSVLGATVVTNDQIQARQLPEQLQNILLNMQVGQTTPPFGSAEEGVRVLMLCGRDEPEDAGTPTFQSVMNNIESERINKRAQRYLRDLRNDAYIEYN